jgi:hypothetical protein
MNWRRTGIAVGGVVAICVSLYFVVDRLGGLASGAVEEGMSTEDVLRLLVVFPVYVAALVLVHLAWGLIADRSLGAPDSITRRATILSCRAHIAKYLPGNVAHLAGRQLLAGRIGIPQTVAASASVVEAVAMPIVGAAVTLAALPLAARADASEIPLTRTVAITASIGAVLVLVGVAALARVERLRPLRMRLWATRSSWKTVAPCYVGFFLLAGIAQAFVIQGASTVDVVIASTVAWVTGFLTPGVPAGIGVREAVMTVLLGLDAESIAVGVIGFRLVMVASDLVLFAVAAGIERWAHTPAIGSPEPSQTSTS